MDAEGSPEEGKLKAKVEELEAKLSAAVNKTAEAEPAAKPTVRVSAPDDAPARVAKPKVGVKRPGDKPKARAAGSPVGKSLASAA